MKSPSIRFAVRDQRSVFTYRLAEDPFTRHKDTLKIRQFHISLTCVLDVPIWRNLGSETWHQQRSVPCYKLHWKITRRIRRLITSVGAKYLKVMCVA